MEVQAVVWEWVIGEVLESVGPSPYVMDEWWPSLGDRSGIRNAKKIKW